MAFKDYKVKDTSVDSTTKVKNSFLMAVFLLFFLGNMPFKTTIYSLFILIIGFLSFNQIPQVFKLLFRSKLLLLLSALIALSYFWSLVPQASVTYIQSQLVFIVFCICISVRYKVNGFSAALSSAVIGLLALVVLNLAFNPSNIISPSGLKSFYSHKNIFGGMMALSALVMFYQPNKNRIHYVLGVFSLLLLAASQSKTSIAVFFAVAFSLFVFNFLATNSTDKSKHFGFKRVFLVSLYGSAILFIFALVLFRDFFIEQIWLNISPTLFTGRGKLWIVVLDRVKEHSLLGIGPGVLWKANGASEMAQTLLFQKDPAWVQRMVASDGTYIDIIASFGMLGLACFLFIAVQMYKNILTLWGHPESKLIFALLTFMLLHAVTETVLLYSTSIEWLLFILAYLRLVQLKAKLPHEI